MNEIEDFQKDLEKTISGTEMDKKDLLRQIFKMYVAKLFEFKLKNARLEFNALVEIKKNLISSFRGAALAENQMSVEQYEELFDKTVEEIFNDAALAHQGEDIMQIDPGKQLIKNAGFVEHPSGLMIPVNANLN